MRRLLGLLLVAALSSVPLASPVFAGPPVHGAVVSIADGNDVSWPQCAKAPGQPGHGLPLPQPGTGFAVVGLTSGLPFRENPCLDEQIAHIAGIGAQLAAYTFAAFPTGQQVRSYGQSGPYDSSTREGQLGNAGYAQGAWSARVLRSHGLSVPVVWLDVEARKKQSWGSKPAENTAVLLGATKALQDNGFGVGYYSYHYGWNSITGGLRSPLPVWATAGRRGRSGAQAMCSTPSFSGGPVVIAQWYDDVRDSDLACPVLQTGDAVVRDGLATYRSLVLHRGSHGPAVSALRTRLGLPASPEFSRATALAVRAFQRARHLNVDGVVGPATWRALLADGDRRAFSPEAWSRYFTQVTSQGGIVYSGPHN